MMAERISIIKRETKETGVAVELVIDGRGEFDIKSGTRIFDHLLSHLAQHGLFDIKIAVSGDFGADPHHAVEDVAISLGRAFNEALGERRGITRMAHSVVPMDEALVMVAVDFGGRGYAVVEAPFSSEYIGELPSDLVRHFLESFAIEGRLNLHVRVLSGVNDHHKVEALFKALGRALDAATRIDERILGDIPSTKGIIER